MSLSRHQFINGKDYERVGRKSFRLLKAVSIGPICAATKLHKDKSCRWRAGKNNDQTGKPLYCQLNFTRGKGWTLVLPSRFHWNGISGPSWAKKLLHVGENNKKTLRASLVHDAIYQGIRAKAVPPRWTDKRRERARQWADKVMLKILKADGYPRMKIVAVKLALAVGGSSASKPPSARREKGSYDSPATEARDIFPDRE